MAVLITGGSGFLGAQLAHSVLANEPGTGVVVFDRHAPPSLAAYGDRVRVVLGDLSDTDMLTEAFREVDAVVHLASVVSADAQADPERAWQVNVEGLRAVLRACARYAPGCPFVFASSVAVFAAEAGPVGDDTKQRPRSTYGMTKAIGELLVSEATQRGDIDGRVARLPTVIVRPGKPNLAASSFASGVFREPLAGEPAIVPVRPETAIVVIGHRAAIAGLSRLLRLPGGRLGQDRGVGLPGLATTAAEMAAAVRAAGARHGRRLGPIEFRPDSAIEAIVASWPARWDNRRAEALGLPADSSLAAIVDGYVADFAPERPKNG